MLSVRARSGTRRASVAPTPSESGWESAITAVVHDEQTHPAQQRRRRRREPGLPGITAFPIADPRSSPAVSPPARATPRDHLRQAFAEAAPRLEALARHERQKRQAQQRTVLELKASTDISFGKIWAANERETKRKTQAALRRRQEAKAILQKGGNPHAVFRSRQAAERRDREEAALDAKRRKAEARIAAMMVREEQQLERGMRQAERARDKARQCAA